MCANGKTEMTKEKNQWKKIEENRWVSSWLKLFIHCILWMDALCIVSDKGIDTRKGAL